MPKDKKIDVYIEQSPLFAQKIMKKLRRLVHKAVPETTETIKWGVPSFEYKGMVCGMSAFKQHVHFSFWKVKILEKDNTLNKTIGKDCILNLKRITKITELPDDKVILLLVKTAAVLNAEGTKRPVKSSQQIQRELDIPDYLLNAIRANKKAFKTFDSLSPGYKREYVEWVDSAKQETTRQKRLTTTVAWLAEGKTRNWKYKNC